MPTRSSYDPGTPCWVDAVVPDPPEVIPFYREVFGWEAADTGMSYWLLQRDGAPVAGLATLTEEMQAAGVPPVWSVSFHAPDVDAACARVTELGGRVGAPPMDIPDTGRMAIVADPQGAGFVLWQPAPFPGAAIVNEPGAWAWNDLQCNDPAAAAPFYEALFGWSVAAVPGSGGVYHGVVNAGRRIGGIMRSPAPVEHPFWMTYFGAADVDADLARVQGAGGRQIVGPTAVPAGRFAVVADPAGAVFALVEGEFDD